MTNANDELTGADAQFGYRFGCDGVVDYEDAYKLLGVHSRPTVNKFADQGLIRRGRHTGSSNAKVIFCRRSILDYLANLED